MAFYLTRYKNFITRRTFRALKSFNSSTFKSQNLKTVYKELIEVSI